MVKLLGRPVCGIVVCFEPNLITHFIRGGRASVSVIESAHVIGSLGQHGLGLGLDLHHMCDKFVHCGQKSGL